MCDGRTVPEQTFGDLPFSADPTSGSAISGTLGIEFIRGVSGVVLPMVAILTNDGESSRLVGATLGIRLQLREPGTIVAPHIDGGYTLVGALDEEVQSLSSRGATLDGGVAILSSGQRGFSLDLRFFPFGTGPGEFRLEQNLLIFSVGIVGFGQ